MRLSDALLEKVREFYEQPDPEKPEGYLEQIEELRGLVSTDQDRAYLDWAQSMGELKISEEYNAGKPTKDVDTSHIVNATDLITKSFRRVIFLGELEHVSVCLQQLYHIAAYFRERANLGMTGAKPLISKDEVNDVLSDIIKQIKQNEKGENE